MWARTCNGRPSAARAQTPSTRPWSLWQQQSTGKRQVSSTFVREVATLRRRATSPQHVCSHAFKRNPQEVRVDGAAAAAPAWLDSAAAPPLSARFPSNDGVLQKCACSLLSRVTPVCQRHFLLWLGLFQYGCNLFVCFYVTSIIF